MFMQVNVIYCVYRSLHVGYITDLCMDIFWRNSVAWLLHMLFSPNSHAVICDSLISSTTKVE